jgi:integrase/recombinase XerD
MEELVAAFLRDCEARGLSPKTVREAYGAHLRGQFLPFAHREALELPSQVTQEVLDRLALELHARVTAKGTPLSKASVRAYLKSVEQFLTWTRRRGYSDNEVKVPLPRLRKRHRDVLTREEVQQLEDAAPTERNKLIIRLMADTGAREGEIAAVRVDDLVVRGHASFVRMRGKTGERLPPVIPQVFRRLRTYAQRGRGRGASSPRLFLAERLRPGGTQHEPLTETGVYQAVKDAAHRAGMGERVFPHLLRHSAITHMVTRGMHPALISEITGVSVAVVAEHYSHASDQDRYEAVLRVLGDR